MSETNKRIEAELRKDWHKRFRIRSIAVAIISLIFMGVIAYSTGESVEVESEVISFYSTASESSESYYILCKLESGNVVHLEVPRETKVKKGSKVILIERQTNFFNFNDYLFSKVQKW